MNAVVKNKPIEKRSDKKRNVSKSKDSNNSERKSEANFISISEYEEKPELRSSYQSERQGISRNGMPIVKEGQTGKQKLGLHKRRESSVDRPTAPASASKDKIMTPSKSGTKSPLKSALKSPIRYVEEPKQLSVEEDEEGERLSEEEVVEDKRIWKDKGNITVEDLKLPFSKRSNYLKSPSKSPVTTREKSKSEIKPLRNIAEEMMNFDISEGEPVEYKRKQSPTGRSKPFEKVRLPSEKKKKLSDCLNSKEKSLFDSDLFEEEDAPKRRIKMKGSSVERQRKEGSLERRKKEEEPVEQERPQNNKRRTKKSIKASESERELISIPEDAEEGPNTAGNNGNNDSGQDSFIVPCLISDSSETSSFLRQSIQLEFKSTSG
jgi:hypothetical protein